MNKRCGEKMIVKRIISMAWEGISVAEYRLFLFLICIYMRMEEKQLTVGLCGLKTGMTSAVY